MDMHSRVCPDGTSNAPPGRPMLTDYEVQVVDGVDGATIYSLDFIV